MTNCRMDGGTCFDPYAEARANAAEGESEGGAPKGGRRGGRGRPPPGARRPPPRVNIWQSLQENCGSWEFDFGCHRTGGYCCYPYP
ncbi:hypothetical protein FSP39_014431 [Pinctada imbricata]|uniref:Uncharacterized protein n=1 Tax=Pinctada imbricata TaxID=66713 RepID=A0AA89BUQ5_PINIB|nr:hypothetical protein FSP39_014431 [Pinctada imbricata]